MHDLTLHEGNEVVVFEIDSLAVDSYPYGPYVCMFPVALAIQVVS